MAKQRNRHEEGMNLSYLFYLPTDLMNLSFCVRAYKASTFIKLTLYRCSCTFNYTNWEVTYVQCGYFIISGSLIYFDIPNFRVIIKSFINGYRLWNVVDLSGLIDRQICMERIVIYLCNLKIIIFSSSSRNKL